MTEQPEALSANSVPIAYPEADILKAIEQVIRQTDKAYGYQHLGVIGTYLRQHFPAFRTADYGCKKLLDLLERHPELFRIKGSAPAHKGRSHVWVRLATEPKRKEGYGTTAKAAPVKSQSQPQLMTAEQFARLCAWLEGPEGCDFRPDPSVLDGLRWNCEGTFRKTRLWLKRRRLSPDRNLDRLRRLGARCDCEVLFNVAERWPDADD
jgi:hypothetical protein